MNSLRLLLLLAAILIAVPSRADDTGKTARDDKVFEIQTIKDITYCEGKDADADKHKLDLYLPRGKKDFPVLFFVHGGAWKSGDRKIYPKLGELYASHGLGTVVISYRLSPQVQHPAHIQDVARAFAWTCRNIGKYGGRADEIFCMGHSAGGHLVALLGTDESYLKAEKRSFADIKGIIAVSGVYRIAPLGPLATAFGKDAQVCKKASPITNVADGDPPFLIIYADNDLPFLGGMAENMCKVLKEHRCDATVLEVEHRDHISIIKDMANADDPVRQNVLEFIKKHRERS